MDTYMHGAAGMFPCKPDYLHGWVKVSEAQAEIARLQAEVDRLKLTLQYNTKANEDIATELLGQVDTARSDAIDAAKDAAYQWAQIHAEGGNTYTDLLHVFRALRR